MKVGDFVELSEAGRRPQWRRSLVGLRGIVTHYRSVAQIWEVSWFRTNHPRPIWMQPMDRREIKHVRVPKK